MTSVFWGGLMIPLAAAEPVVLQTDHAMAVHLPLAGLNRIGEAIQNIMPPTIPVASGTNTLECSSTTELTYSLADLDLIFSINDVAFVTTDGALDLLVSGHLGTS